MNGSVVSDRWSLRKLLHCIVSLFFLTLSPWSWAQVACAPSSSNLVVNMGATQTLKSAPAHKSGSSVVYSAGQQLGVTAQAVNTTLINSNFKDDWPCLFWRTYGEYPANAKLVAGVTYNGSPVFETGVAGIGYSVRVADTNGALVALPAPAGTKLIIYTDSRGQASGQLGFPGFKAEVIFVSTGAPISLGTHGVNNLIVGVLSAENRQGQILPGAKANILANATFEVPPLSCSLTSEKTMLLPLPDVNINVIKQLTVNSLTMPAPESPIKATTVSCPAGIVLYATVVDANNMGNVTDKLSTISSTGSAQGVGISLRRAVGSQNNQWYQVVFGPDSPNASNTNQWLVSNFATAAGNTSIHFKAKYIRTNETVSAGTVEAKALLVFSYQ